MAASKDMEHPLVMVLLEASRLLASTQVLPLVQIPSA